MLMAVLKKFSKAPVDRKRYSIDYADWLDAGEIVNSVTFGVTPAEPSAIVVDGIAINPGAKSIMFYTSGGADATVYKVFVTMTTSGGQVKEDTVQYSVRAP
jgi:hypothetical protein